VTRWFAALDMAPAGALALGLFSLPALLLPRVLPAAIRAEMVTVLAAAAFALAIVTFTSRGWPARWTVSLFLPVVLGAWFRSDWDAPSSVSHFGGIAAGVLVMVALAAFSITEDRLLRAMQWITLAAIGILVGGLASMEPPPSKFMAIVGPASDQIRLFDTYYLPQLNYGFLGVQGGHVNPNALGGTALLLLPLCLGAGAAGRRSGWRALRVSGDIAATLCFVAVVLSASRTAIYGTFVLGVLFGAWRWPRLRMPLAAVCLLAGGIVASRVAAYDPSTSTSVTMSQAAHSLNNRLRLWREAASPLLENPILGIGINTRQFLATPDHPVAGGPEALEAHAHNQLLQVALDTGLLGLLIYLLLFGGLMVTAMRLARGPEAFAPVVGGALFSLVAVHVFGLVDAIALGAKVGVFQWIAAGLIVACAARELARERRDSPEDPFR